MAPGGAACRWGPVWAAVTEAQDPMATAFAMHWAAVSALATTFWVTLGKLASLFELVPCAGQEN